MSYGVALRNGIPFTLGTIAALCVNATSQWSPLALWPDGISTAGMWISPSTLPASFNDYTGTTPVATPGTVADSANPVGLALDIRAGAPDTLGPELVTNGNFSNGTTGWTPDSTTISVVSGSLQIDVANGLVYQQFGTVTGKTYRLTFDATFLASGYLHVGTPVEPKSVLDVNLGTTTGSKTFFFVATGTTTQIRWQTTATAGIRIDNVSVREIPGNHMLQASTTARPLESARVNYLWQDLAGTTNGAGGYVRQSGVTVDDLGSGVYRINFSSDGQGLFGSITLNNSGLGAVVGTDYIGSIELSVESGTGTVTLREPIGSQFPDTDVSLTTTWTRFDTPAAAATTTDFGLWIAKKAGSVSSCLARFPQLQIGSVATDYQRITSTSDYDATGITPFQLYDGTDDGMATAAFAAGTLINGLDCMIPVRRDSAANAVCGLYESVSDANKVFGIAESGSSSGCVGSGAGTPTVWVDNTQLTGGTAVTRGTLHTALTVGDWHIVEFRNLDLSTWTASGFGLYTSYVLNGPRGDIMLFPSPADATERDNARQYLADLYGVTLP